MRKSLATVADVRGELALLVFHDALTDTRSPGVIDANEVPYVLDHLTDWKAGTKASREAKALAHLIECGGNAGVYFDGRISEYRAAVDEIDELGPEAA